MPSRSLPVIKLQNMIKKFEGGIKLDLLFPSGVGRTNITVALSMLAVKSPFDSDIACQAKLRSKYSFFAASVYMSVSVFTRQ
jgi:hypothetical protein